MSSGPREAQQLQAQSCARERKQRQVQIEDLVAEVEWLEAHVSSLRAAVGKRRETLALLSKSNSELKDSMSAMRDYLQLLDREKVRLLQSTASCGAGRQSQVDQQSAPLPQENSAREMLAPTDISVGPWTDPLPATLQTLAPTSISAPAALSLEGIVPGAGHSHGEETAHRRQLSSPMAHQHGPSSETTMARLRLPSRGHSSEDCEAAKQLGALSDLHLGEQPASLPGVAAGLPRREALSGVARAALPADVWSAPVPFAAGMEKGWHAADCLVDADQCG